MMRVVVILVDRQHGRRNINDSGLTRTCAPDEPVVPPTAAECERKKVGIKPFAESEIIDEGGGTQNAGSASLFSQAALPGRVVKIDGLCDVQVGALADHQQRRMEPRDFFNSGGKIVKKNDVRIHVAKEVVGGVALGLGK